MQRAIIVGLFGNPSLVHWWKTAATANVSPEFAALVEEILGEGAEQAEPRADSGTNSP